MGDQTTVSISSSFLLVLAFCVVLSSAYASTSGLKPVSDQDEFNSIRASGDFKVIQVMPDLYHSDTESRAEAAVRITSTTNYIGGLN
jgi:hypothetical protein